ncbi:MAG: DUF4037 domain-containing protein [Rhodothermaceae bacterium]|nr:DUF4037 domain-containing protein [Rhodothermaceae bacterium]
MDAHFKSLLDQVQFNGPNTQKWVAASKDFIPDFMKQHDVLMHFLERTTVILHGSTALNVDDPHSDLDYWLILDDEEEKRFQTLTNESFVPLRIHGKVGHINPLSLKELEACFSDRINMVLAYEVKNGIVIEDTKEVFESYRSLAQEPLTDDIQYAHFFRNYIEMRASHRSCDNPMERHDPFAMLYNVMDTLKFALQAAFVLDRMPYPYDKWIYAHAHLAETPRALLPGINNILAQVTSGFSALRGPEGDNKISQELRVIRGILIDKAQQNGIDALWLNKWWRYIDESKRAVQSVRWGQ